jgi:iron complex outermembrane receptor protein
MSFPRPFSALALLIAVASALPGQSTGEARLDTTRFFPVVVVSASRAATSLRDMSLSATVVTAAEIRKSPAQTLDQLLRDVPGVNLPGAPYYTTDPTGQQTKMRGLTNSKVLMLVDGVPVHDPFYSTTQWFKIPLSSIERVEVVRGGSSSLWGNLAVAGVVNVITKKPIDGHARVDMSYQSRNTSNVAASKNFVVGSDLAIRVSGDLLNTDGYQTTPAAFLSALPGKGASSAKNGNAQIAAYYNPAGTISAFFRAGYHQQNENVGGYRYGANLQKSPDAAVGLTKDFGGNVRGEVRAWGQYESFDKSNGAACYLASASNCNTTSTAAPLVQYENSHDDNPYRELGASAVLSMSNLAAGIPSLQIGADFRTVGGEDRATTFNRPTTGDVASATINRTNFGRGTQRFNGTFAQLRVTPFARFDATMSLRYDYWTNTGGIARMTRYSNGQPGTTLGGAISDSHKGSLNPSIAARYALNESFSLRGAAYRAFRAPGLNNLYRSFSTTTFITIANAELEPETLTGGEAGFDLRGDQGSFAATYFMYDTRNLIASYRVPNAAAAPAQVVAICGATLANCPATVNFNTNGQDAVSRGLELVGTWRFTNRVSADAGYTYTDAHYTSATTGDPVHAQLGAVAKNLATAGITWQPTTKWRTYTSARHNGTMFLDVNHTIRQPAFTLVNISTSYDVSPRFELYGSVANLTDVKYADNATTSAAGQTLGLLRSFTSGVRLRF